MNLPALPYGHALRELRLPTRLHASVVIAWLLLLTQAAVAHAVTVTPMALYIDQRTRSATLTLYNGSDRPEEIDIAFAFGYPRSDSTGAISVPLTTTPPAGEPSAVSWLRAFPRRLVLQPGQQQVVRILVAPPAGLETGEYWGRVVVTARGGQAPIEEVQGEVRMQIAVQVATVASLAYRSGEVSTGVEIAGANAARADSTITATVDLARSGNAAFLGRVVARLLSADGAVLQTLEDEIAIYHELRCRFVFAIDPKELRAPARVEFTIDTERSDLPASAVLPARAVHALVDVSG